MFKINSYTDLKVAYEILEIAYESGRSQKAADLKREMRAFFHRRHYYPSAYDCTGQAFTSWYKVFARGGRFWAYHRVSVDV